MGWMLYRVLNEFKIRSMSKVKVLKIDQSVLDRLKEINIKKAKDFLKHSPFSTPVHMALITKMPLDFIINNRKEIGI